MNNAIKIAAFLGVLAFSTGQLPRVLKAVRILQLELIKDSQASKWGKGMSLKR